jgi:hypothetical protein
MGFFPMLTEQLESLATLGEPSTQFYPQFKAIHDCVKAETDPQQDIQREFDLLIELCGGWPLLTYSNALGIAISGERQTASRLRPSLINLDTEAIDNG